MKKLIKTTRCHWMVVTHKKGSLSAPLVLCCKEQHYFVLTPAVLLWRNVPYTPERRCMLSRSHWLNPTQRRSRCDGSVCLCHRTRLVYSTVTASTPTCPRWLLLDRDPIHRSPSVTAFLRHLFLRCLFCFLCHCTPHVNCTTSYFADSGLLASCFRNSTASAMDVNSARASHFNDFAVRRKFCASSLPPGRASSCL